MSHIFAFLLLKNRITPGQRYFRNLVFRLLLLSNIMLNSPTVNPVQNKTPTIYANARCEFLPLKFDFGINKKEDDDMAKNTSLILIYSFGVIRFSHIPLSLLLLYV